MGELSEEEKKYQNEQEYQKFNGLINDLYDEQTPKDVDSLIEQVKNIEKFTFNKRQFFYLFDHTKFFPIYMSKNISQAGFTQEEVLNMGLRQAFKHIYWKHILIPFKIEQWRKRFCKIAKNTSPLKHESQLCGVKMRDKYGDLKTTLVQEKFLRINDKGLPLLSFAIMEDITHHYKADFCWMRKISNDPDYPVTRVFFTSGSKKEQLELLRPRELEILQLVREKKDSSEIAEILSISRETVKKHRKNMIARVGAKDMTSLLHICQFCNLL